MSISLMNNFVITVWLFLKPGPGPWTQILQKLDHENSGPRISWTLKNLDPE